MKHLPGLKKDNRWIVRLNHLNVAYVGRWKHQGEGGFLSKICVELDLLFNGILLLNL